MNNFWTLGYEGLTSEVFLKCLNDHDIEVLVDVRQRAGSRKRGFAKTALKSILNAEGIKYVHLPALGTPAELRKALKDGAIGQEEYLPTYGRYLDGHEEQVEELLKIVNQSRCCLLCLEADPVRCHRSILAEHLIKQSIHPLTVDHICRQGLLTAQPEVDS